MGLKRFDYKIKDNTKKRSIIVASIIVLVLLVGIGIYATFAAYKVTKTYNVIQGKVGDFVNADLAITIKTKDVNGNVSIVDDFPDYLEYSYLSDESSCDNGSTIGFNEGKWTATISASSKDKCTLTFEQRSTKTLKEAILANTTLVTTTPDFSVVATDANTNIYQAEDDLGTSYYFRGATTNNYVKFGQNSSGEDLYWRIIRTNGDNTVRMIYDGTSAVANGVSHTANIGSTAYNPNNNGAKYAGYTYDVDGVQTDSTIKTAVDKWYKSNLGGTYDQYIADNIFCNDRSEASYINRDNYITTTTKPTGTNYIINYGAYDRLYTNKNPQLRCMQDADKFTVNKETGNGLLNYPIALITADEIAMAGGVYNTSNESFYLYNGLEFYWTTSPYSSHVNNSAPFIMGYGDETMYFGNRGINSSCAVRPVINLNANIKMYGSGTMSDPYRLTKEL